MVSSVKAAALSSIGLKSGGSSGSSDAVTCPSDSRPGHPMDRMTQQHRQAPEQDGETTAAASTSNTIEIADRRTTATSADCHARTSWSACTSSAAQVFRTISGRCQSSQPKPKASRGTTTSTQPATRRRAAGRSSATRGSLGWPGTRLASTGRTLAKRSGTPARSGEHVIAVEPDRRDELLQHLEVQDECNEEEQPVVRDQVDGAARDQEQHVEVETTEVGADASRPAEPVRVGDVGVERGEDQVHAVPDAPRLRPAVAAGGGVTHLVQHRSDVQQAVTGEHERRGGQHLLQRDQRVTMKVHLDIDGYGQRKHSDHKGWPEHQGQRTRDPADRSDRYERALQREREQWVGARWLELGWLGRVLDQSERLEACLHQVRQPIGGERPAVCAADDVGNLVRRAARCDRRDDEVQQLRDLDDLTVASPKQVRRFTDARSLAPGRAAVALGIRASCGGSVSGRIGQQSW